MLLHISLFFVRLPVLHWQDFEVLEDVDVGVLPDGLDHRNVGRVGLVGILVLALFARGGVLGLHGAT